MASNVETDAICQSFQMLGVKSFKPDDTPLLDAYDCGISITNKDNLLVDGSVMNILDAVTYAVEHGYRGQWEPITDEMAERWLTRRTGSPARCRRDRDSP